MAYDIIATYMYVHKPVHACWDIHVPVGEKYVQEMSINSVNQ